MGGRKTKIYCPLPSSELEYFMQQLALVLILTQLVSCRADEDQSDSRDGVDASFENQAMNLGEEEFPPVSKAGIDGLNSVLAQCREKFQKLAGPKTCQDASELCKVLLGKSNFKSHRLNFQCGTPTESRVVGHAINLVDAGDGYACAIEPQLGAFYGSVPDGPICVPSNEISDVSQATPKALRYLNTKLCKTFDLPRWSIAVLSSELNPASELADIEWLARNFLTSANGDRNACKNMCKLLYATLSKPAADFYYPRCASACDTVNPIQNYACENPKGLNQAVFVVNAPQAGDGEIFFRSKSGALLTNRGFSMPLRAGMAEATAITSKNAADSSRGVKFWGWTYGRCEGSTDPKCSKALGLLGNQENFNALFASSVDVRIYVTGKGSVKLYPYASLQNFTQFRKTFKDQLFITLPRLVKVFKLDSTADSGWYFSGYKNCKEESKLLEVNTCSLNIESDTKSLDVDVTFKQLPPWTPSPSPTVTPGSTGTPNPSKPTTSPTPLVSNSPKP